MNDFLKIFVDTDQELIRRATLESGRVNLCWYPSAGLDFRHVRMLEEERLSNSASSTPLLYLHTDMLLPRNWNDTSRQTAGDRQEPRLLARNDIVDEGMFIADVTEIRTKKLIREINREVYSFEVARQHPANGLPKADRTSGILYFRTVSLTCELTFLDHVKINSSWP